MGDEDADDALEAVIMRESGALGDCGCQTAPNGV
jgi:hypothetical protein